MDLTKDIGKTLKMDVEKDGQTFHYTARILEADDKEVKFVDKYGNTIRVPTDKITFVEESR